MKRKLKAFTLVELVIVMGMFMIIMFSVLQLLDPVTNYFVRSSNFEYTTSCVDNIKRAIDGNLKYADRVRMYYGFEPYTLGAADHAAKVSSSEFGKIRNDVANFYREFFEDRVCTSTSGKIYVMTFDNRVPATDYSALQQLSAYNENKLNRGEIDLYEFEFDNYGALNTADAVRAQDPIVHEWYVNESLYGNFDYCFRINADNSSGVTFNPNNFRINITMAEVRKKEGGGLEKILCDSGSSVYFSMKNVLDVTTENSSVDYKITLRPGVDEDSAQPTDFLADPVQRYVPFTQTPDTYKAPVGVDMDDPAVLDPNCFYFIFTVPEQIFDGGTYVDNLSPTAPPVIT